jgi:hypothetical protein
MPKQAPLTALLSWVWIAHTLEVDNAVEASASERVGHHFRISLPMWTNGLRLIDEDGITVGQLRSRARAACNLGGLERWGWVSVGEVGGKRRDGFGSHRGIKDDTVVRPTRAGGLARRVWPRVLVAVEERWRARFGAEVVDELRQVLLTAVTPMPWSPPEVHPSDGFYSHTLGGDGTVDAERPLAALLGQVLTRITLDHEQEMEVSLPLGANVLRVVATDVVRSRDLPALTGISREGTAMATRYLQRRGLATAEPEGAVRLTPPGLDALDSYWHRAAQTDEIGLRAALEGIVAQRDPLAAGLVPPPGCWRGEKPYVTQTERLLVDPVAALPWHPMVLHRGAWPDGS